MLLRSDQRCLGHEGMSVVDSNLLLSSMGPLSLPADLVLSEHVVGGRILLPGVGFVEMVFAHSRADDLVLSAVAFVKPCILPNLSLEPALRRTLRHTSQGKESFEISSGGRAIIDSAPDCRFQTHVAGGLRRAGSGRDLRYPDVRISGVRICRNN